MGLETTEKNMQIEKELQNIQYNLRRIHAAYDDKGEDLSAWPLKATDTIDRLGIALRIKTEEHQCCTEDLMALRNNEQEGWKEAAIAWEVCSSIHNKWAKGKDALYSTRHEDFVKHADDARKKLTHNAPHEGPGAASSRTVPLDAVVGRQRMEGEL
jgi:hypothetical protein